MLHSSKRCASARSALSGQHFVRNVELESLTRLLSLVYYSSNMMTWVFYPLETVLGFTSPLKVTVRGRTRFSIFNTPPTCEAVKLDHESVNSHLVIIHLYIDNETILEEFPFLALSAIVT